MRVSSIHTYFGGFVHGLRECIDVEFVQDWENWTLGSKGASASGLPVMYFKGQGLEVLQQAEPVDMIVANPPCSRYSLFTKAGSFDDCSRSNLDTFEQLQEAIYLTRCTGARTLWWETGPLCWTRGRDMVKQAHEALRSHWGDCRTLMVRYDTRFSGVPQKRQRVHVIHSARTESRPVRLKTYRWLGNQLKLGEWVERAIGDRPLRMPCHLDGSGLSYVGEKPSAFIAFNSLVMNYMSAAPAKLNELDDYSPGVVSRRAYWEQRDRWLDLLELAALMDYPLDITLEAFRHMGLNRTPQNGIALLSKSVSPAASRTIFRDVLIPWLYPERLAADDDVELLEDLGDGMYCTTMYPE